MIHRYPASFASGLGRAIRLDLAGEDLLARIKFSEV